MEYRLSKGQAITAIIAAFFVAVIVSGLIAQQISDDTAANGVRTMFLILWVLSIGVIWKKTKPVS